MDLREKYRPRQFSEVIGNELNLKILKKMITEQNLPRGLMLVGPPGTGKSTLSHLIRMSLVCEGRAPEDIEPCWKCPGCKYPHHEWDLDCTKMTSEDLREILFSLGFRWHGPFVGIEIFDEFQRARFNIQEMFLKTLEEDRNGRDLLIIFCVMDLKKICEAFQQRVQVLYTNPPKLQHLVPWLSEICRKENFTAETKALELIARSSGFLPRGCLMLLQKTSHVDKNISTSLVKEVLMNEGRLDAKNKSKYSLAENSGEVNWETDAA